MASFETFSSGDRTTVGTMLDDDVTVVSGGAADDTDENVDAVDAFKRFCLMALTLWLLLIKSLAPPIRALELLAISLTLFSFTVSVVDERVGA